MWVLETQDWVHAYLASTFLTQPSPQPIDTLDKQLDAVIQTFQQLMAATWEKLVIFSNPSVCKDVTILEVCVLCDHLRPLFYVFGYVSLPKTDLITTKHSPTWKELRMSGGSSEWVTQTSSHKQKRNKRSKSGKAQRPHQIITSAPLQAHFHGLDQNYIY